MEKSNVSKVWLFFTVGGINNDKAICKICRSVQHRGRNGKHSQCTSGLWKHLNKIHPDVSRTLQKIRENELSELDASANGGKRSYNHKMFSSKIWKFFCVDEVDESIARCYHCSTCISRGADRNTTSMWNHLKKKHSELYSSIKNETKSTDKQENRVVLEHPSAIDEFSVQKSGTHSKYICKTCGVMLRLDNAVAHKKENAVKLSRHLNTMFHKRVVLGLENPKTRGLGDRNKAKMSENGTVLKLPDAHKWEEIVGSREVDMVQSMVITRTLYAQQQQNACCDFTVTIPQNAQMKNSGRDKKENVLYYETDVGYEFKIHSCVAGIISKKMKSAIENSFFSIEIEGVSKETISSYIEIAYLGKLKNISNIAKEHLFEMYNVAQSLESPSVMQYLDRECPDIMTSEHSRKHFEVHMGSKNTLKEDDITEDVENTEGDAADSDSLEYSADFRNNMAGISPENPGNSLEMMEDKDTEEASPSGLSLLNIQDLVGSRKRRSEALSKNSGKRRKQTPKRLKEEVTGNQCTFEINGDTAILRSLSDERDCQEGDGSLCEEQMQTHEIEGNV